MLLTEFYNPCRYKGVYYFKGSTGEVQQIERNSFGTKEQRKSPNKDKPKHPFRLQQALSQHVSGYINFAMRFKGKDVKGNIIAFDMDCKDYPQELLENVKQFRSMIRQLGIEPLIYHSGGKGYHIEIRVAEPVTQDRLAVISKWLADKAIGQNIRFLDKIYPYHKPAYRIFGSWKLDTGQFTKILTDSGFIEESEECWLYFERYMNDNSVSLELVDQLYDMAVPPPTLFEKPKKREKSSRIGSTKRTSKDSLSINLLLEFYHMGLRQASTRHNISFQLGRLFRYWFGYSESEAVTEITDWIQKHFNGTFEPLIHSPYDIALTDSITEVRRAYTARGFPFHFKIELDKQNTSEYMVSLQLSKPLASTAEYILGIVSEYKSLVFRHSNKQFMDSSGLSDKGIRKRLKKLQEIGFIRKIEQGNNITNKTTKYRLNIPANCYSVVEESLREVSEEII